MALMRLNHLQPPFNDPRIRRAVLMSVDQEEYMRAANGDDSWELPVPATFIVAQDGTIRLAFVDADWTHRLEPAELLKALERVATN